MILSLEIKNFMSFKEKTLFSFEALKKSKSKSIPEENSVVVMKDNTRINKLSVLYGANASGKSNLIKAFNFLDTFWVNIAKDKNEFIRNYAPFLLESSSENEPSEFILIFYVNDTKHIYTLIIKENKVVSEKLEREIENKNNTLFERKDDKIVQIDEIEIDNVFVKEIEAKCLQNMSFFAAYKQVNIKIKEIDDVISWHKLNWMQSITTRTELLEYTKDTILNDAGNIKNKILDYIRRADFNIVNIEINQLKNKIPDELLPFFRKSELINKEAEITLNIANFTHQVVSKNDGIETHSLSEGFQSDGTIRLLGLAGIMANLLNNDAFITVDEIEASLHPKLIKFLISDFLYNSKKAQLLIATHYDSLLEETDLIRKDSIWFTNKKSDGSTELYSVVDFEGYRTIKSLLKAYRLGIFGATPDIVEM